MDVDAMSELELQRAEEMLLARVPEEGTIGNRALFAQFEASEGWTRALYDQVRQRLVNAGRLGVGRGYGGSVYRFKETRTPDNRRSAEQGAGADKLSGATNSGTDLLELTTSTGGKMVVLVQGQPSPEDLDRLQQLLIERYAQERAEPAGTSRALDGAGPQDPSTSADLPLPTLAPEKRAHSDPELEGFVTSLIETWSVRKPKHAVVLVKRFGLDGEGEKTLEQVGGDLGVTREYVRQLQQQITEKARATCQQKAVDLLEGWLPRTLARTSGEGDFVSDADLEQLRQSGQPVDGWVRLVLDIAYGAEGATNDHARLAGLADDALVRYQPFGISGWVRELSKVRNEYRDLEPWVRELATQGARLPLPLAPLAATFGKSVDDVMTVASAHEGLTIYAGYLASRPLTAAKARAIRAHVLAGRIGDAKRAVNLHDLWREYRRRFDDVDPCSSNDLRVALKEKKRGATHLFVVDTNQSVYALGPAIDSHGLALEPNFGVPHAEALDGNLGALCDALSTSGPQCAEDLAARCNLTVAQIEPPLGQRPTFSFVTPRHYWLAHRLKEIDRVSWSETRLLEDDALDFIAVRQCGECPRDVYPGWTPEFERALCEQALGEGWACFGALLWACTPQQWSLPDELREDWVRRKSELSVEPREPAPPNAVTGFPDALRLLGFILAIQQTGSITPAMANRATRRRGVREVLNTVLLAILVRVQALDGSASSHWSRHSAGPDLDRWCQLLVTEYMQDGELSWAKGVCRAMLEEALQEQAEGWAGTSNWTRLIEAGARSAGLDRVEDAKHAAEADEAPTDQDGTPEDGPVEDTAEDVSLEDAPDVINDKEAMRIASEIVSHVTGEDPRRSYDAARGVAELAALATGGDVNAQYRLAVQLERGIGAAKNPQAARYWLERAAEARHVSAAARLGRMLWSGQLDGGTRKAKERGLAYLTLASRKGHPNACFLVAMAYHSGDILRRNPNAALMLLKRSARAGHGPASLELAKLLRQRMQCWVPDTLNLLRVAERKGVVGASELLQEAVEEK